MLKNQLLLLACLVGITSSPSFGNDKDSSNQSKQTITSIPLDQIFIMPKAKPLLFRNIQLGILLEEFKQIDFPGKAPSGALRLITTLDEDCPTALKESRNRLRQKCGDSTLIAAWMLNSSDKGLSNVDILMGEVPTQGEFLFFSIEQKLRLAAMRFLAPLSDISRLKDMFEQRYGSADTKEFIRCPGLGNFERYLWSNSASQVEICADPRASKNTLTVVYSLIPALPDVPAKKWDPTNGL
ncbi:MAG: hypothetical protein K2W82_05360 [Candidatus Obscuribacterales bacterium]|nr:hypothetical protein [Candidatus Obscuribacterales bacterium]